MPKYDDFHICTSDRIVEVGKEYEYKEDAAVLRVRLLEDTSTDDELRFIIEVREVVRSGGYAKPTIGETFALFADRHSGGGYSGAWRLYDVGAYTMRQRRTES